jgi:hypothetical protein
MYDLNMESIKEWAGKGYNGETPRMQYAYMEGEKERITTKAPAADEDDPWKNGKNRRTEAPPEQYKLEHRQTDYLQPIKDAWAEGDPLLKQTMLEPEQIRGDTAKKLQDINKKISELTSAHAKETKDTQPPDLRIPVGLIIHMIVESVESSVESGKTSMNGNKEAERVFGAISATAERMHAYVGGAKEPGEWLQAMSSAYEHHLNIVKENDVNFDTMHDLPSIWSKDLKGWILDQIMASGQRTETIDPRWKEEIEDDMDVDQGPPAEARVASQDLDTEASNTTEASDNHAAPIGQVGSEANQGPPAEARVASQDLGNEASNTAEASDNLAAPIGQVGSEANQGQPPASPAARPSPVSNDWVTTGYFQHEDGKLRHVGGLHKCGASYQILLRMNEEEEEVAYWHMIGSITARADRERWIDQGGHVIGAFDRSLTKGLRNYSPSEFTVKGIAVVPRKTGETYTNRGAVLIQGFFSNTRFKGKKMPEGHETFGETGFYIISALRNAWGDKTTEVWFSNLMKARNLRRPVAPEGGKTLEERKTVVRNRRKVLKGLSNEVSEGSEDITQESDGELSGNDGGYTDVGDDFIEPNIADETTRRKSIISTQ